MRLLPASFSLTLIAVASGLAHAQPQDAALLRGDDRVLIFFAWDRPIVDGDAAARLDDVAASFLSQSNVRLELAGHADRSGSAALNVRSGRRRAEAVAAYLADRGVPGAAMRVTSYGEARPLIPTADGVREPQNRRVEILAKRGSGV